MIHANQRYPSPCPECGAESGRPCQSQFTGKRVHTHKARPKYVMPRTAYIINPEYMEEAMTRKRIVECALFNCGKKFLQDTPYKILCGDSDRHYRVSQYNAGDMRQGVLSIEMLR